MENQSLSGIACFILCGFVLICTVSASAQILAPGKLIEGHKDLEGITNCTSCHQVGKRGVFNPLCLDCHTPINTRIDQQRGFHATVSDQNCGSCHKDHYGPEFDMIRFDTLAFDHTREGGFALLGSHENQSCRSCHQPDLITDPEVRRLKMEHGALTNTYLGLPTQCMPCHASVDPHGPQFEDRDCDSCHLEDNWEDVTRFNHDDTDFPLLGKHLDVACESCHQPTSGSNIVVYTGISSGTCESCHVDVHQGSLGTDCQTCHDPTGWDQLMNFPTDRFDHDETGFSLVGKHRELDCMSCHVKPARTDQFINISFERASLGATYSRPRVADCMSCHVDYHEDIFTDSARGSNCESCHSNSAWTPALYDFRRHNEESTFTLTGAHLATPCVSCHASAPPHFDIPDQRCESCHSEDNPHGIQFADLTGATECTACHVTQAWPSVNRFDHNETRFPLTGQHLKAACASCHLPEKTATGQDVIRYRDIASRCEYCHGDDEPHRGQFAGVTCEQCHDTDAFFLASFDHEQTQFPLDGAHRDVACLACHHEENDPNGEVFIRYKPLGNTCQDCHTGTSSFVP